MDCSALQTRLALHTWTLDTTPLADALRIARETGWNGVELRRVDFMRAFEAGITNDEVIALIRASGIKVITLGTEAGWIFARGEERRRLLSVFEATCENAAALGCDLVMSAPGPSVGGDVREAAASLRETGAIARTHNIRHALEFSSAHDVINRLEIAREVLARADHPNCGLVLDAYHLERSGAGGRAFEGVPARDIFAFQYSDVPLTPAAPGRPVDRLPPGQGVVRWREIFELLIEKDYAGYLSYEAPNPAHWSRPPQEIAREGAAATRALLAG